MQADYSLRGTLRDVPELQSIETVRQALPNGRPGLARGRADVRRVLYMATQAAIRHNPDIAAFAKRLNDAGKLPKVVIVACMRKLLTVMNTMIKSGQPWHSRLPAKQ